MEYLFFFTALLLLIGSVSMAIPSKSSREIAKVRMESKLLGCKISSILNAKSKFKNKESLDVSYHIKNKTNLKEGHFIRDKGKLILYSPMKLKYTDKFNYINSVFQGMSVNLVEVIFNEVSISFLWKENTGIDELKKILIDIDKLNNF